MEKYIQRIWKVFILLCVLFGGLFWNWEVNGSFIQSFFYRPDIKTAMRSSISESDIIMKTVIGEEGIVCFCLSNSNKVGGNDKIYAYTFKTRIKNREIFYKVYHTHELDYTENKIIEMIKMNTSSGSTEQIVYGINAELARECSERTGIDAEFVHFGNDENEYTFWYIISISGLDDLPQPEGVLLSYSEPAPTWFIIGPIILFLPFIVGIIAIVIDVRKRKTSKMRIR